MKFLLLLILLLLSGCSTHKAYRKDGLSIIQGVTGPKEVEFSIVAPKAKTYRFELRSAEGDLHAPADQKIVERSHSNYKVIKIIFDIENSKDYNLYAYEGTSIVDQRLVGKGPRSSTLLKLAVASCMNDNYDTYFPIWTSVARKNPDYLLMIGDNVYADKDGEDVVEVDPERLWNRYVETRLKLPIFYQTKLIPIHAIWDDHDFGLNDGGAEYKYKEASAEIFDAFFAQSLGEDNFLKGPGVASKLNLGDFDLYFLDGRSFRTSATHLGQEQQSWLVANLIEENTPSLIIKGDQFFGSYFEGQSFEGNHPQEFEKFISDLKKTPTPFVFLSGDRHYSEVMQFPRGLFGRPSFELTSSTIGSGLERRDIPSNPWRVVLEKDHQNFLFIENTAKDNHWFLDVESIGVDGSVYFRRELAVYIKDLQNNLQETRKRRQGQRRYKRRSRRSRR